MLNMGKRRVNAIGKEATYVERNRDSKNKM